jgi:hypothetical protein
MIWMRSTGSCIVSAKAGLLSNRTYKKRAILLSVDIPKFILFPSILGATHHLKDALLSSFYYTAFTLYSPSTLQSVMRLSSLVVIAGGLAQLGTVNGFSLSRPSLPRWTRRDDAAPQAVLGWFRIRTSTSRSFLLT